MAGSEQRALEELRRMIINGDIAPGEKITEASSAELLGLSRTPVRVALNSLVMEGLIERREGRGFTVREIKTEDLENAIRVRGVLEGLAAGTIAANGISKHAERVLRQSIAMSEAIIARHELHVGDFDLYQDANQLFHRTIIESCGNDWIGYSYERVSHLKLLGVGTFAFDRVNVERERLHITISHSQHVMILDAMVRGEECRAETLMREHANATIRYSELFAGRTIAGINADVA